MSWFKANTDGATCGSSYIYAEFFATMYDIDITYLYNWWSLYSSNVILSNWWFGVLLLDGETVCSHMSF